MPRPDSARYNERDLRRKASERAVPTGSPARTWTVAELPEELRTALQIAIDKSARAPVILRVSDLAGYTDWVMILSGRSDRHVSAIADGISRGLKSAGKAPLGTDGFDQHVWDLLDCDDFIVHVFYHPVRMHFDLESMWSDAPRVELGLPAEVMDTSDLDTLQVPDDLPAFRGGTSFGGFEDEFEDELPDEPDDDEPASKAR